MSNDLVSKEGREKCWFARDLYWKCLDDNENEGKKCLKQRELFEKDCSKTWVNKPFYRSVFAIEITIKQNMQWYGY
jgi:cytochrome c oxidase assembly factor 6